LRGVGGGAQPAEPRVRPVVIVVGAPSIERGAGVFVGGQLGKDVVEFSDIQGRAVEVAIPKGTMTPQQREIIEAVKSWAKTL
jgi:hypothetical protein